MAETSDFRLSLYQPVGAAPDERRFKIYRKGGAVSLTEVLPMLSRSASRSSTSGPYELRCADRTSVGLRIRLDAVGAGRQRD